MIMDLSKYKKKEIIQLFDTYDINEVINRYTTNFDPKTRCNFGTELLDILKRNALEDILSHIFDFKSILIAIAGDRTPEVRYLLVEQIPYIFIQCRELNCEDLENYLYDSLAKIVLQYLSDNNIEVRRKACESIQKLLENGFFGGKQIAEGICLGLPHYSKKATCITDVEFNESAIFILKCIVPLIGAQKVEEIFLDYFLENCTIYNNAVRRAAISAFPIFCYILGTEITEKRFLPKFLELCNDDFLGVREACLESVVPLSIMCTDRTRRELLTPAVIKLSKDRRLSRTVSKILGQFISTFAKPSVCGLTFSESGELLVVNPVDPDFRETSSQEILAFYDYYLKIFEENTVEKSHEPFTDNNDADLSNEEIAQKIKENIEKMITVMDEEKNFRGLPFQWATVDDSIELVEYQSSYSNNCGDYETNETNKIEFLDQLGSVTKQNSDYFENVCSKNDEIEPKQNSLDILDNEIIPFSTLRRKCPIDLTAIVRQAISYKEETSEVASLSLNSVLETSTTTNLNDKNTTNDEYLNSETLENDLKQNQDKLETMWFENEPKENSLDISDNQNISNALHRKRIRSNSTSNRAARFKFLDNTKIKIRKDSRKVSNMTFNFYDNTYINTTKNNETKEQIFDNSNNENNNLELSNVLSNLVINESIPDTNNTKTDDIKTNNNNNNNYNIKNEIDDAFTEYNSYKYWYISPELPLNDNLVKWEQNELLKDHFLTYDDPIDEFEFDRFKKFELFNPPRSYKQNIVPHNLLENFVNMAIYKNDEEMYFNWAFNFPVVIITIGRSNWHLLKPLLLYLCDDLDWKRRKTFAITIDIFAKVLGVEISTKDLVPIYLEFFQDTDEVRIEAVRNFGNFLRYVEFSKHNEILSNVIECLLSDNKISLNKTNWRLREDLAKQLVVLINVYKSIQRFDSLLYLTSLAGLLLQDKVSCIRDIAADVMSSIIRISSEKYKQAILQNYLIKEFANSENWRKRQTFLNIFFKLAKSSIKSKCIFYQIIPEIKKLSLESVPNIRIMVAKALVQIVKSHESIIKMETADDIKLIEILRCLQNDEDCDVKEIAEIIELLNEPSDIDHISLDSLSSEPLPSENYFSGYH